MTTKEEPMNQEVHEVRKGGVGHNEVVDAKGIGIICMDHSMCDIRHNTIVGTKVDGNQDPTRQGVAIQAYYYAEAQVHHNTVVGSPGGVRAFDNSTINAREFHN